MARRSFRVTGTNNPDKQVSANWTNDLAGVVERGCAVTPQDFGAVGDGVTNDGAAFAEAIAYLKGLAVDHVGTGFYKGGSRLFIPAGHYYLGTTTLDLTHTLTIEGEGSGQVGGIASRLRWADDATGIRVQRFNTSGDSTVDSTTHTGGDASIIRGLYLQGGGGTTGEHHGIHLKGRAVVEDVFIQYFQGDCIHIRASSGVGAPNEGNANNFAINRVGCYSSRNGIYVDGADANAGIITAAECSANRKWGIWDSSFLGNTYVGCHVASNGWDGAISSTPTACTYNGNRYAVVPGQEAWCSTNAPSGTTAHNQGWRYMAAGGTHNGVVAWVSGTTFESGGAYYSDDTNARNLFIGCYSESDQNPGFFNPPAQIIGGLWGYKPAHIAGQLDYCALPHTRNTNQVELWGGGINMDTGAAITINGTQVLGAQGAAVADATDNASAITQLNALLARCRAHGLIAT